MAYVQVAIGIIVRAGMVLVTRRPAAGTFPGLWEFPGGKLLAEESVQECLHREIQEELGIQISVAGRLAPVRHDYEHTRIMLHPFVAVVEAGEPRPLKSEEMRWMTLGDLAELSFPEANRSLVEQLPAILRALSLA